MRKKTFCRLSVVLSLLLMPVLSQAQAAGGAKATSSAQQKKSGKTAPASPVDLNSATQDQLESVPGIGATTAKKIIAGRLYSSVSDLSKAGITAAQLKTFSSMVKVVPSTTAAAKSPAQPSQTSKMASTAATSVASAKRSAATASSSASSPAASPAPGGGAGMVWVNTETKVFHKEGSQWYGKTKQGKYMTEADALKAGYHASKQKS